MIRHWSQTAVPEAVGYLRAAACNFASAAGIEDPPLADARIALSEALTNAVVHSYREVDAPGAVAVTATVDDGTLWLVITDNGCGFKPRQDSPGLGLGLPIIAALADTFDILPVTPTGTAIHMTFDNPQRETGDELQHPGWSH